MASRVLGRRLGSYAVARFLPAVAAPRHSLALTRSIPLAALASSSSARAFGSKSSSGDSGLLKVLKSEIEHEKGENEGGDIKVKPPSPFTLHNESGRQEVILRRSYNSEDIAVTCLFRVSPYDEPEEEEESEEDEPDTPVSQEEIHMVVTIAKGGDGPSLEISCTCSQGEIEIEKISYLDDESSKDDELAYTGPVFGELDENLQKQFTKYLEARGINEELCNFLVNYMPEKERQEYIRWLEKIEKFVKKEAK
ncbi:uncharacterized protein At2g39795, mitochondrial [Selaginella moellendorffii]|nr:uncharacterized protein At2g39795, mitochondrial [Selaginella moellendorffii]|eukprot:XP_002989311.2 uncharacterized protein At2g39795, mitochondrial [Selaginella moellendorffii]